MKGARWLIFFQLKPTVWLVEAVISFFSVLRCVYCNRRTDLVSTTAFKYFGGIDLHKTPVSCALLTCATTISLTHPVSTLTTQPQQASTSHGLSA